MDRRSNLFALQRASTTASSRLASRLRVT